MGQDLDGLKRLLTEIAALNIRSKNVVETLASPEIAVRTRTLSSLAKELGLKPKIITDFDLPGIEARSVEDFVGQAYYRFFPDEKPRGQERLR